MHTYLWPTESGDWDTSNQIFSKPRRQWRPSGPPAQLSRAGRRTPSPTDIAVGQKVYLPLDRSRVLDPGARQVHRRDASESDSMGLKSTRCHHP